LASYIRTKTVALEKELLSDLTVKGSKRRPPQLGEVIMVGTINGKRTSADEFGENGGSRSFGGASFEGKRGMKRKG